MYVLSRGADLLYRGLGLTYSPIVRSRFEPDSAPPAAESILAGRIGIHIRH